MGRDEVPLLDLSELDSVDGLPPGLRAELEIASRRSPVAASFVGGHPVSFCNAAAQTESLWDVSIDTLEEFRTRGHAARCVAFVIEHTEGRESGSGRRRRGSPDRRRCRTKTGLRADLLLEAVNVPVVEG